MMTGIGFNAFGPFLMPLLCRETCTKRRKCTGQMQNEIFFHKELDNSANFHKCKTIRETIPKGSYLMYYGRQSIYD